MAQYKVVVPLPALAALLPGCGDEEISSERTTPHEVGSPASASPASRSVSHALGTTEVVVYLSAEQLALVDAGAWVFAIGPISAGLILDDIESLLVG